MINIIVDIIMIKMIFTELEEIETTLIKNIKNRSQRKAKIRVRIKRKKISLRTRKRRANQRTKRRSRNLKIRRKKIKRRNQVLKIKKRNLNQKTRRKSQKTKRKKTSQQIRKRRVSQKKMNQVKIWVMNTFRDIIKIIDQKKTNTTTEISNIKI